MACNNELNRKLVEIMKNKIILVILLLCLLFVFIGCNLDIIKTNYTDWDALVNASENQKGWFPPLFKSNLSFENKVYNIVIFNNIDTNVVWGKFNYSDDLLNYLPMQISAYRKSVVFRSMRKMGFDENKIDFYFTENQSEKVWHYFVDTSSYLIYFRSERL